MEQSVIEIPKIPRIMVPVDGSESSQIACQVAGIIAKALGAKVTAVYIIPRLIGSRVAPDKEARAALEKSLSMLTSFEGVAAKSEVLEARSLSVSDSLIDYLEREKADLVICGHRGLGGFERMLVGSVSSSLAAHSPASVMVVRKTGDEINGFKRILIATDGSRCASEAVGFGIALAKALSSKLTFTNVVYMPPASYSVGEGSWLQRALDESREEGRRVTDAAAKVARDNGVEADTRVIDESLSVVSSITKLAEDENYDLIILGTRGLGGFKKLALGSVAEGVVHYAHCSVLVAK